LKFPRNIFGLEDQDEEEMQVDDDLMTDPNREDKSGSPLELIEKSPRNKNDSGNDNYISSNENTVQKINQPISFKKNIRI